MTIPTQDGPQQCLYSLTEGELQTVECSPGQSCYAITSVAHINDSWIINKPHYSLGCWDPLPYCSEKVCNIDLPSEVWGRIQFPRFCCCRGPKCNDYIQFA